MRLLTKTRLALLNRLFENAAQSYTPGPQSTSVQNTAFGGEVPELPNPSPWKWEQHSSMSCVLAKPAKLTGPAENQG